MKKTMGTILAASLASGLVVPATGVGAAPVVQAQTVTSADLNAVKADVQRLTTKVDDTNRSLLTHASDISVEVSRAQGAERQLRDDLTKATVDLKAEQNKVAQLRADLTQSVTASNKALATLREAVTKYETSATARDKALAEADKTLADKLVVEVETREQQVRDAASAASAAAAERTRLAGELTSTQDNVAELTEDIAVLRAEYANAIATLHTQLDTVSGRLTDHDAELAKHGDNLAALATRVSEADTQLGVDIAALEARVNEAKQDSADRDKKNMAQVNAEFADVDAEIATIKAKHTELQEFHTALSSRVDSLEKTATHMGSLIQNNADTLQTLTDETHTSIAGIHGDIAGVRDQYTQLEKALSDSQAETQKIIDALNSETTHRFDVVAKDMAKETDRINGLFSQVHDNISRIDEVDASQAQFIADNEAKIAKLTDTVATLSDRTDKDVVGIRSAITALDTRVGQLEHRVDGQDEKQKQTDKNIDAHELLSKKRDSILALIGMVTTLGIAVANIQIPVEGLPIDPALAKMFNDNRGAIGGGLGVIALALVLSVPGVFDKDLSGFELLAK